MTPAATPPPPVAPAAPANLKVSETGEDFIEWTWDRVAGAAGYIAQFSTDSRFGAGDPAFTVEGVANTKHKVSNLDAASNGYLRVRAYIGTAADPTSGEWTEGAKGTTEEAAAPVTTALSAPTGLRTGSETTTTVTLTWNSVDDADSYDVDQRPADGSWTGASCDGGDSRVNNEECEASGLTRGTNYSFRVRANPDPDDDTLEQSAWSSSASAQTSGSTPSTPITSGDDELNITWESDGDSITWFWDPPSDNRISYIYALLRGPAKTPTSRRPTCPALTAEAAIGEFTDISDVTNSSGWYGGPDGFSEFARELSFTGNDALGGSTRGLCVRRTWEDEDNMRQYGDASVAWATTAPAASTQTQANDGPTDSENKTTRLDWSFDLDEGFVYEIGVVSATIDTDNSDLGSCDDVTLVGKTFSTNRDGEGDTYRHTSLSTYTEYRACVRAKDGFGGMSSWTDMGQYKTLPGPPSGLSGTLKTTTAADNEDTQVDIAITWSFSTSETRPKDIAHYQASTVDNAGTLSETLTKEDATCASATSQTVADAGSKFSFGTATSDGETTAHSFIRESGDDAANRTGRVLACVRAATDRSTDGSGTLVYGPWSYLEKTKSVPKQ